MSKAAQAAATIKVIVPTVATSQQIVAQPVYLTGEKAYYLRNGVQLPVIIRGARQAGVKGADGNSVYYTVVGDITDGSAPWLAGQARGPFVNVPLASLSDRTV